jgi:hypothetical protein
VRIEPTLWLFWEQGRAHLQTQESYNAMCLSAWQRLNPGWRVRLLDKTSRLELFPEMHEYSGLSVQMTSDLLRLLCLTRFGGAWADISTLPMKPLSGNVEPLLRNGCFMYRYLPQRAGAKILASSWFLVAASPHLPLYDAWLQTFQKNLKAGGRLDYFAVHHALAEAYHAHSHVRRTMDQLQVSEYLSHSPLKNRPYPPIVLTAIDQHPLMYKRAKKIDRVQYLQYIEGVLQARP